MGEILLSAVDEVSVMDVYELAHDIGKATEQLIGAYGAEEPVQNLIQKVIVALELLEGFAEKNQQENGTVTELMERVDQLEAEKRQRSENRQKFEKEVETVEDQWRTESRELLGLVARLQEENKRLLLITANDDAGGLFGKIMIDSADLTLGHLKPIYLLLSSLQEASPQVRPVNRAWTGYRCNCGTKWRDIKTK